MCVCSQWVSHDQLFVTSRTVARQASLSMGFPKQEYWSGLSFLSSGHLPDPDIEAASLVSLALAGGFFTTVPQYPFTDHYHIMAHVSSL